jgi:predicted nuclease of predicted toxin-antitoxin system
VKNVVDVCLSPQWVAALESEGIEAVHWTTVGDARSTDRQIVDWAREHGHVIFTNDLDFGAILALTHASGPSAIQVRSQDVLPAALASTVLQVLEVHGNVIEKGALITVDAAAARVRILPIGGRKPS